MERICEEHYKDEMVLLQSLPGVSKITAICLIAETGADMSVFENSGKLTDGRDCVQEMMKVPENLKSKAITKGNKYLSESY